MKVETTQGSDAPRLSGVTERIGREIQPAWWENRRKSGLEER